MPTHRGVVIMGKMRSRAPEPDSKEPALATFLFKL